MAKSERMEAFLAHANIVDALCEDQGDEIDVVALLSDVASLSEQYIPTLQFLMRPDNLTALVQCILQEPASATAQAATIGTATDTCDTCSAVPIGERPAPGGGEFPNYDAYALVFRAHWVLCASGFSSQLIAALVALESEPRDAICRAIVACDSRDTMVLEALTRFLNVFMDQYSPEAVVSFFGETRYAAALLETLLVLNFYESIRDVLLRILNDVAASVAALQSATTQLLLQLAPMTATELLPRLPPLCPSASSTFEHRIAHDATHVRFARMLFTCDLLTDVIHERRSGSLGHFVVDAIATTSAFADWLIAAALHDLHTLPTAFANESYTLKVLNSLLQQSQCGCVTKAAFLAPRTSARCSGSTTVTDTDTNTTPDGTSGSTSSTDEDQYTQGSPHEDLPVIWKAFIARLPAFLAVLQQPRARQCHFKTVHVQVLYLLLPILNVSCTAVDAQLMRAQTLECALELVTRFPAANILHCAIVRLFIVALEDSPFMFGKELPSFRAANDPLRLHLLRRGCLDTVLRVFGAIDSDSDTSYSDFDTKHRKPPSPPPAFLDIAISFDQALTTAQAHSPHLFAPASMAAWQHFRTDTLLPTQQVWEEQYEPRASPAKNSLTRFSATDLLDPASELALPAPTAPTAAEDAERISTLQRAIAAATLSSDDANVVGTTEPPQLSTITAAEPLSLVNTVVDVATPLSALYNDEEKDLMRKVAAASASSSPTAQSSLSLA